MPGAVKIGLAIVAIAAALPILGVVALFVGMTQFTPLAVATREIRLPNHGSLIIDGQRRDRSEHGFSQRAGYRPPGSTGTEWFGEVSDGVEPQVYQAGPLVVVIDPPAAQLYVRTQGDHAAVDRAQDSAVASNVDHVVSPTLPGRWKNIALIFPNDLGPFPVSYYAGKNGLTEEETSRINQLGGKRERKYPTTYIQSFDPETRDLECSYQVDNTNSWPLHLRLSDDGTRLVLIEIGGPSR
jgi:hypothetical protein